MKYYYHIFDLPPSTLVIDEITARLAKNNFEKKGWEYLGNMNQYNYIITECEFEQCATVRVYGMRSLDRVVFGVGSTSQETSSNLATLLVHELPAVPTPDSPRSCIIRMPMPIWYDPKKSVDLQNNPKKSSSPEL